MKKTEKKEEASLGIPGIKGTGMEVSVHRVFPNTYNPNRMDDTTYKKTLNSLSRFALSSPLICREIPEGFEIIDGEHRFKAAQELGMEKVAIWNLGIVSDSVAKQLTIMFNELKGRPDVDLLAGVINDLVNDVGMQELIDTMPYSEQQMQDLIDTLEFNWESFEAEDPEVEDHGGMDSVRLQFICTQTQADSINGHIANYLALNGMSVNDENKAVALTALCNTAQI